MSAGSSKWHSTTDNIYGTMDAINRDKFFASVDARQRELDEQRKRNRVGMMDRNVRASSFFEEAVGPANRFQRGHSVARLDSGAGRQSEASNWSNRTRSNSTSRKRPALRRCSLEDLNVSAPGNLSSLDSEMVRSVRMDMTPQSSSMPSSPGADDALFVKPTLPSITRMKPPRIYSSEPISRSRLTVPKRRFSPEPESKYTKALSGWRRPTAETVDLIDLKRIFQMSPSMEFDLPSNFTTKYRKRTSLSSDAMTALPVPEKKMVVAEEELQTPHSLARIPPIPLSETVDFSLPASFTRSCTPTGASNRVSTRSLDQITPAGSSGQSRLRSSSCVPVTGTCLADGSRSRELPESPKYRAPSETQQIPITRSSRVIRSPNGESVAIETPKSNVEGRVTRHIAKVRSEHEMEMMKLKKATSEETAQGIRSEESMHKTEPQTREHWEGEKKETATGKDDTDAEKTAGVTAEGSFEVALIGEEEEKRGSSEDGELKPDGHPPSQNLSVYEDDDEETALHIVETTDDDEVASSEERATESGVEQQFAHDETSSKDILTYSTISAIVSDFVEQLLDKVCGGNDEDALGLSGGLITEPLRRPGERRVVPPLRIRLPQPREVRERRPARSKDYSPPGWGIPRHKQQAHILSPRKTSQQEHSIRRSSRVSKSATAHMMHEKSTSPSADRWLDLASPQSLQSEEGISSSRMSSTRKKAMISSTRYKQNKIHSDALENDNTPSSVEGAPSSTFATHDTIPTSCTVSSCTTETIWARIKESEGLIADLGSFASQFSIQSEQLSDIDPLRPTILDEKEQEEKQKQESDAREIKQEESIASEEADEVKEQNAATDSSFLDISTLSEGRQSRRKTIDYPQLFPELFPMKRKRRSLKTIRDEAYAPSEPSVIPIPFEEQSAVSEEKSRKQDEYGKKVPVANIVSSSEEVEVKRPDYNEMADSPMLSASERKQRREARLLKSATIPEQSATEMGSVEVTIKTEEPTELADQQTDNSVTNEDSTLMISRRRESNVGERKSRRGWNLVKPISAVRSVSGDSSVLHGLRSRTVVSLEKTQLTVVTRSRAHSGPLIDPSSASAQQSNEEALNVASTIESKELVSMRRARSKAGDTDLAGTQSAAVPSMVTADLVPIPAKTSRRSKKLSSASVATIQTSIVPVVESSPKLGNDLAGMDIRNETDSKGEVGVKQLKVHSTQSRMPYFKRISLRKKLCPLAIGLKSRMDDDDETDDFYREILLRGEELKKVDEKSEVDVDVDTIPPMENDEMAPSNPAIAVASALDQISPRPTQMNDDTGESEELGLDDIRHLVEKECDGRRLLVTKMLNVISAQYTADMATQHVMGGASIQYNTMMMNAYRLRGCVPIFTKDKKESAKWAHKLLIESLPLPMLATYINLLRYCKILGRSLIDLLLREETDDNQLKAMNNRITDFIFEKVYDPQTTAISRTLNKRCIDNVYVIAVSPSISHADYRSKERSHEYMFKTLLPNVVGEVEQLRITLPMQSKFSVCEAAEFAIDTVAKKVTEVRRKHSHMRVVLAGWGTSCVINHQVVNVVPNVSAILDFAFPLKTAEGMRGDVDDDILLTYCPSLFIIGEEALDCDVREMQRMAYRMKAPTGVIVIGSADNNLHVSMLRLCIERFTQRTVERALLDDIVDFLERYCSRTSKNVLPLRPILPRDTNDVDLSIFKASSNSNFSPRYVPVKEKRELESDKPLTKRPLMNCDDEERVFKRPHTDETIVVEASGSAFQDNTPDTTNIIKEAPLGDVVTME